MNELVKQAKLFAIKTHFLQNQKYDDKEYAYHLYETYNIALKFIHLITENVDDVLAACWTHDLSEDCNLTYNNIQEKFNINIAEITYAVTTEKGKTRKDRANDKYYSEMKLIEGAVFVKLCDRIANMRFAKHHGNRGMYEKYKKLLPHFKEMLYREDYKEMFDELEKYYYQN